jgi:hypothetical protein
LQPTLTPQPLFYPIILLRPIIFSPKESIFPIPSAFSFCRLYQSYWQPTLIPQPQFLPIIIITLELNPIIIILQTNQYRNFLQHPSHKFLSQLFH